MIVFNLSCLDCDFSFEGWFENSNDYNKQIKQGLVSCPSCNSIQIRNIQIQAIISDRMADMSEEEKQEVFNAGLESEVQT